MLFIIILFTNSSPTHWLIFIVNKRTNTCIYNLCNVVIIEKKLTSVFYMSVLLFDNEFYHDTVKVAVDPRGDSGVDPQTSMRC